MTKYRPIITMSTHYYVKNLRYQQYVLGRFLAAQKCYIRVLTQALTLRPPALGLVHTYTSDKSLVLVLQL